MLPNGLTVLCQENKAWPAVTMSLSIASGASDEPPDSAGLTSLMARLLTRGTATRDKFQIGEVLDFTGANMGASAGRHTTGLGAKARDTDFDEILELMAECARAPSFPVHEVEKARGERLTAIAEDDDDTGHRAMDRFRQLAYPSHHPYSKRVAGTRESVQSLTREAMIQLHEERFDPGAALLVIVGAISCEAVLRSVERSFGDWRSPGPTATGFRQSLSPAPDVPPLRASVRGFEAMPSKTQVDLALGHAGVRREHPDYYDLTVMNMILGRFALGGRLGRRIREEHGMSYYTYSTLQGGLGPGAFVARAGVAPEYVDAATRSILEELKRIVKEPPETQELEDTKSALVRSVPRALESNEGVASTLTLIELYDLGSDYVERYPGLIARTSATTVQAAAARHLHPACYALSIAGPCEGLE